MKIATFNANSIRMRLPIVLDWLDRQKPDVLCVQETKVQNSEFPRDAFADSGYHVEFHGMKAYNGVAMFTRRKPDRVFFGLRDNAEPDDPRLAHIEIDGVSIVNTYVPQGYLIDSPKYPIKLEWLRRLKRYFDTHLKPTDRVIWCGDMNVAPSPLDVHHPEKHDDHVCYHIDARKAYEDVVSWGFTDVFRKFYPDLIQYTFWDYRYRSGGKSSLDANLGWRIDHIMASTSMAAACTKVEVDLLPRRAEKPSDHTVLWAEFSHS